jgi:hypothetical protein
MRTHPSDANATQRNTTQHNSSHLNKGGTHPSDAIPLVEKNFFFFLF